MPRQSHHDRVISQLADRQNGVVSRLQLLAHGVPAHIIDERVRTGRLVVLHRGVYALGHRRLRREGHWLAAALARGPEALLGHGSAARLWDIWDGPDLPAHVIVPRTASARRRRGIVVHRVDVAPSERATRFRIPVTSVPRTILDLAATVRGRELEQVVRRASRRRLFDLRAQRVILDRHPRDPGAPELGRLLAALDRGAPADLRSRMEIAFAQLCDDHGLPRPLCNPVVEGERVDFWWPGTTLVVETDGFEFHEMPTTFAGDRHRDQKLTLRGYTVLRLTYDQVIGDRERVAKMVATMLRRCRCS